MRSRARSYMSNAIAKAIRDALERAEARAHSRRVSEFVGSAMSFLVQARAREEAIVIAELETILRERARVVARAICDAVARADDATRYRFSGMHARMPGAACTRIVEAIFERLPVVGCTIEWAAHPRLFIARGILILRRGAQPHALDDLEERIGVPPDGRSATVGARKIQTLVINVQGMGAFARAFVAYARAILQKNEAAAAIIIHGRDLAIEDDAQDRIVVKTRVCSETNRVTFMSVCEKKIIAVSDIFQQ